MQEATESRPIPGAQRGHLLRILGVVFGIAVAIGGAIAAGIVRTPGDIATRLPVPWMFLGVWVIGAIYALLGAAALSELGAMIPREGGQFVFSRRAIGDYAGFVVGWSDWVSTCGAVAAIAIVVGEYSGDLIPALHGHATAVAVIMTLAITVLQWRGIVWGSRTQEITAALKTLGFLALVVACFIVGRSASEPARVAATVPRGWALFAGGVAALGAVIYSYDSWDGIVYFLEEVKDPAREVPRAMFGSVFAIMAVYLLISIGLVYVLPLGAIAGNDFALGVLAQRVFGAHGDLLFRILMIVSLTSALNANQLMGTRVLFAMSRDGFFARAAAGVNRGGTPSAALFLSAAATIAFITTGSFEKVIAIAAFFFVANYGMSFLSVFILRRREPNLARPYRAWGYPWSTGVALAGSVGFIGAAIAGDTRTSLWALGVLAVSYPVFLVSKLLKS